MPPDLIFVPERRGSEGWWKKIFTLSFIICFGAMVYSASSWQWHWFARSGALMVVAGVYLTGSQLVESGRRVRSPSSEEDEPEIIPLYKDNHSRWYGEYSGLILLVLGTLIWGFGDLPSVLRP